MVAVKDLYEVEVEDNAANFTAKASLAQIGSMLAIDHNEHEIDMVTINPVQEKCKVIQFKGDINERTIQSV